MRLAGICALLTAGSAYAAVPSLDCLYPIAVARGTNTVVTAVGKFDPWPVEFWTSLPGVTFAAETNKGKVRIEVSDEVPAGPCFVRAYNESGPSPPRFLVITDAPIAVEQEPNNDLEKAHPLAKLPAIVEARFDKTDDIDVYRVELVGGQTLVASLECYLLASPVDAVLRLLDQRGVEVAFNHDDGRTFDPQIIYTAPKTGSYFLQAFGFNYPADSNIRFVGNDKCIYRLHVKAGSCPMPEDRIGVAVCESEPNDKSANANALEVPAAIRGCIGSAEDQDAFKFVAKKGDKLLLKVEAAAFGFPLDARLRLEDEKQKELAKAEDSKSPDPILDWTAPEDGTFFATVRNLLQRGGPDHLYQFSIQRPQPTLRVTVAEHAFQIKAGQTNNLKVKLQRTHGFDAKLALSIKGLPDDVRCEPAEADGKANEAALTLVASPDSKPFTGPFRIMVKDERGTSFPAVHELISAGENNGVPNGYSKLLIDTIEELWLTVTKK